MPRTLRTAAPLITALCALGFAACGSSSKDDTGRSATTGTAPSSNSSSSPAASTPAAVAARARDGQDPVRSGCAAYAENVPRTGVQLRGADDRPFAAVLLRRSLPCVSAWGVALGVPEGQGLTLTLETVHVPGNTVSRVVTTGPFPRTGVNGEELVEHHGCVFARATVRHGSVVVGHAQTPCG
jgi:hypothetical protein